MNQIWLTIDSLVFALERWWMLMHPVEWAARFREWLTGGGGNA